MYIEPVHTHTHTHSTTIFKRTERDQKGSSFLEASCPNEHQMEAVIAFVVPLTKRMNSIKHLLDRWLGSPLVDTVTGRRLRFHCFRSRITSATSAGNKNLIMVYGIWFKYSVFSKTKNAPCELSRLIKELFQNCHQNNQSLCLKQRPESIPPQLKARSFCPQTSFLSNAD